MLTGCKPELQKQLNKESGIWLNDYGRLSKNQVICHRGERGGAEFQNRFQPSAFLCTLRGRIYGHCDLTGKIDSARLRYLLIQSFYAKLLASIACNPE